MSNIKNTSVPLIWKYNN